MDELKTRYITAEDFKIYFGVDLASEMEDDNNPSNKVDAFLTRIENRMEAFINATFFKLVSVEYPKFTDFQKKHYKLALLEQAYYVFQNGDISTDSGYDLERGEIASNKTLKSKIICENAKNELILCGLRSTKIRGNRDGFDWF